MSSRRLQVVWEGDFGGTGSLAQVNIEIATRLAVHVDLRVVACGRGEVDPRVRPLLDRSLARVDVTLRHGSPPILEPPEAGRWVWMQPWEYGPCLPLDWLAIARERVDALLVYSPWVRAQLVENGLSDARVHAVPLGVDLTRFRVDAPPRDLPTSKRCRLLYLGGLTHRKGIDIVLRAYREAFTAADDVVLVIKEFDPAGAYAPIAFGEVDAMLAGADAPASLRLPVDLPAADLPGIYTACSALVHPYRAEGFCLPMAEAMACARPVIATDLGGASDFATPATATLLPSVLLHLPSRDLGRRRLSNFPDWREADRSSLVAAMREVFEHPERFEVQVQRARQLIHEQFTWDHAAAGMRSALEAIVASPPRAASELPPPRDAAALVARAAALLEVGDLDHAAADFHRALGPASTAPPGEEASVAAAALAGLGRVAWEHGIPENTYRFHRLALEHVPDDSALKLVCARFATIAGHRSEAVAGFESLLASSNDAVRAAAAEGLVEALLMGAGDSKTQVMTEAP